MTEASRILEDELQSPAKKFQIEIRAGLKFLNRYSGAKATVFGSHRVTSGNIFYDDALLLGKALSKKGYTLVNGGGPGIMQATARGCLSEKGICLGLRAKVLTNEHVEDKYYSALAYF